MELADLMNPQITFSKTTMDDILARSRYSVKAAASTSTTNKVPASVKTQLSSLLGGTMSHYRMPRMCPR